MKSVRQCRNVLLVLSGKGGVGKSTMTRLISSWLSKDYSILVIDVDLTGPSTIHLFKSGEDNAIESDGEGGWVASLIRPNLYLMSLGLLLAKEDDAVIWRGPKKTSVIEELLTRTVVPSDRLDLVLIDTPPGTSDEHIATIQTLKRETEDVIAALLVTSPASVSLADVRRQCAFCSKLGVPVLGIVENMAYVRCECCLHPIPVFGSPDAVRDFSIAEDIAFMGSLPFVREFQTEDGIEMASVVHGEQVGCVANALKTNIERVYSLHPVVSLPP